MQEPVKGQFTPLQHLRVQISADVVKRDTIRFYLDVLCLDPGLAVLDDDHRPTDPPPVARDMNCLLVMVNVHPDEFIDFPCSPQFSETIDKTSRIAGDADDGAVDVNNKGSRGIDFRSNC